jgi:hypothetical protein
MAWEREVYKEAGWLEDIYYTVRDTSGNVIKGITKFTNGVAGEDYYETPTVTALSGNRALLAYHADGDISYAVLNSAGNTVQPEMSVGDWGYRPDAVQLSNGNIILAWGDIGFVVIDDTTYDVIDGPNWLYNEASITGDAYVSVTADEAGHGILTWMDQDYNYRRNLYYALVDGSGAVLTDPMIFRTSQAAPPRIESAYNGYGNTSYSLVSATTNDVDAWVSSSLAGAAPEGMATIPASLGNHGSTAATSVVLTATLDSNLSYNSASPAPKNIGVDTVVWNLADIGYLGSGRVILHADVPSATIGTRYPVTWTLASAGPEADMSNNTTTTEVMLAHQIFLPLISRGD